VLWLTLHEVGHHPVSSRLGRATASSVDEVDMNSVEEVVCHLVEIMDRQEAIANYGALFSKCSQASNDSHIHSFGDLQGLSHLKGIGIILVRVNSDIDVAGPIIDTKDNICG